MEKIQLQSEEIEKDLLVSQVLGWTIEYSDSLAGAIAIDHKSHKLIIKKKSEMSLDRLRQISIFAAARETALLESLRGVNFQEASNLFSKDKEFVKEFLNLSGMRLLKEREPRTAKELSDTLPPSDSLVAEFKVACALYLATGEFPRTSDAVTTELKNLPISAKGEHLLSAFTSEQVALSRKKDYFDRFLSPAFKNLRQADMDLRSSQSENFKPSTDDSPENQELDESEIKQRILPFVGGYFRETVMDGVNWEAMSVMATGVNSEKILPPEEERIIKPEAKIHTFKGINGKELASNIMTAPLPGNVEVFPETATKGLIIRRSVNGVYTIEWPEGSEPFEEYEFAFERKDEPQNWQKLEPTEIEQDMSLWVMETFSPDTKSILEELRLAYITDSAKVRQIANRVQKTIEYVNDSAVGAELSASGNLYFSKLEEIKKGDCDVSNFYALAQIRALGIPCRMITGFHVRRDKRFSFSALAGTKHAWLEWWNKDSHLWERIDATPPKLPDEEEKDDNEGGGGEMKEMVLKEEQDSTILPEETDDDPFGLPFTEEELAKLKESLSELSEASAGGEDTSRIFQDLYGISRERWEEIRSLAETIGQQRLSREVTIDKKYESTVEEEWKRLYDCLLIAYRLPDRSRRIIGRQSQGGELTDPVSAGIDVMVGHEDPYGFEKRSRNEQIEMLPINFSNDFLLDITASMTARNQEGKSLLELEREFVISSLYEGYKFNERIKQRSSELTATPLITNHILSIHGGGKWQEIIKKSPIELKELSTIDEMLKKPTLGAGAMAEALEQYAKTLEEDIATITALQKKEMVKTLTIMTDGNLWCSACGKESCSYEHHGPTLARVNKSLGRIRELGVIINTIGFTEQSRPVTELFAVAEDPEAVVVIENLGEALTAHYRQITRSMKPVIDMAEKRRV